VAREIEGWRRHAESIPDAGIREDALAALAEKRFNAEGAALFAALPPRRDAALVRVLVAFQILLDFLDTLSERPAPDAVADGRQLHLALRDALDPQRPRSDYYRHHPQRSDGGYVRALVECCRESCLSLPAYGNVRSLALRAAARCSVQGLNHDPDGARRESTLEGWARSNFPTSPFSWWELTAAASSTLGIHALLALAADPTCARSDAVEVEAAYMPWICAASTMLDSYADEEEDAASGAHSYLAHYPSSSVACRRTRELVGRSLREARRLPNGSRHALIAAGMVAMYLSTDGARTPAKRDTTRALARAGGARTLLLMPVLRVWRTSHELRTRIGSPDGRLRAGASQKHLARSPRPALVANPARPAGPDWALRRLVRTEHSGQSI
jgi:tetraprenyl-beta-curcumene synthase